MKLSNLVAAMIAAGALVSLTATVAHSAPAPAPARDYVVRAVPASSNPHEVFFRLVKIPKTPPVAEDGDHRVMKDRATAHHPVAGRTPKG